MVRRRVSRNDGCSPTVLQRQTKLPRLDIHWPVESAIDVIGNFASCVRTQPLLRHRNRRKSRSRMPIDQVRVRSAVVVYAINQEPLHE